MNRRPATVFLDTNIYIIGAARDSSPEAQILDWAGFGTDQTKIEQRVVVILSNALINQITRVARRTRHVVRDTSYATRRTRHKDWAGEILSEIWQYLLNKMG